MRSRSKKQNDPTKVVAYYRVSTDEQGDSGAGLAAQRTRVESEITHRNWTLIGERTDVASGKSTDRRPGLREALELVRAGEAGTLMVAKLDRLSRSVPDFAALVDDARTKGWNLVALDLGIDMSTPTGELVSGFMAYIAQWERRIIGERTKLALAEKRKAGVRLGRPSLLSPELVHQIRADRRDGVSYGAIARALNEAGVPTVRGGARWYPSTVRAAELSQQ